ncbi:MAG: flagellar hook-length control protein FliK [Bacillota bacterium]
MLAGMASLDFSDLNSEIKSNNSNYNNQSNSQKNASSNFLSSLKKKQNSFKKQSNYQQQNVNNENHNNSKQEDRIQRQDDIRKQNDRTQQGEVEEQNDSKEADKIQRDDSSSQNKVEEADLLTDEKVDKLKELLKKDIEELSTEDLEALLANLNELLQQISEQLKIKDSNEGALKEIVESISANAEQLEKLINDANTQQQDNPLKDLIKEMKSIQKKLLATQQNQAKQSQNKAKQQDLKNELSANLEKLNKLLEETNAKLVKSSTNSNSKANLANNKLAQQFSLAQRKKVEPKKKQQTNPINSTKDINLDKLLQQTGINPQKLNSVGEATNLKVVTKNNESNLDFNNLSDFKAGQFKSNPQTTSQSISQKSTATKTVDFQNILKQMNNKLDFSAMKQGKKITMQLEPEFLGKMQIKIGVEDGSVTAKILAESNQIKDLLSGDLAKLKSNLEQKGIEIDQFDVSVGYQEGELEEQNNSQQDFLFKQQQERNKLKKFSLESADGEMFAEEINGSLEQEEFANDEVDYRA